MTDKELQRAERQSAVISVLATMMLIASFFALVALAYVLDHAR